MTVGWRRRIGISLPKRTLQRTKTNTKGCCWDPGEYIFYLCRGSRMSRTMELGSNSKSRSIGQWEPDGMRRDDAMLWWWSGIRWKVCIVQRSRRIVRNFTETKSNPFFSMLFASENDAVGPIQISDSLSPGTDFCRWEFRFHQSEVIVRVAPVFVHLIECKYSIVDDVWRYLSSLIISVS